jgi:hypothetical protein
MKFTIITLTNQASIPLAVRADRQANALIWIKAPADRRS